MKTTTKPRKITVEAPPDHPDVLDVGQAMRQVMDYFDLLTDQRSKNVVWRLVSASMNSPLTVEGIPFNLETNAPAHGQVMDHVSKVERGMICLREGKNLDADFPAEKIPVTREIFRRNLNGIGRTRFDFGNETRVDIHRELARQFLNVLEDKDDGYKKLFSSRKREAFGSIDGKIVSLNTNRDRPSIGIQEHNSGQEINCLISDDARIEIEKSLTAGDAWKHRRVRVRGIISYDANGKIVRLQNGRLPIRDGQIQFIEPKEVTIGDLHDPDFTGGLPAREYLEKLRENDFD